jgi:hypothetical protein
MTQEVAFVVDLATGSVEELPAITLESAGLWERRDLQRWIAERPSIIEPGLLLVTSEFDDWEARSGRVADRLDLLFLDRTGSPLVAELKRDQASETVDLQALKYAAYCSTLKTQELIEQYASFHAVDLEVAREVVLRHAPALAEEEPGEVRIRLVAGGFGPGVTSVVLWLRDRSEIDIGCTEVTARSRGDGTVMIAARQIIPLPQAEDYLVRRRRREESQEVRTRSSRGANSIAVLAEAGLLTTGTVVRLGVSSLIGRWQEPVAALLEQHPDMSEAEWTGETVSKSLRWRHDRQVYSASGLTKQILSLVGIEVDALPGPDYWLLPDGRPMYRASVEVRSQSEGVV